MRLVIISDTHGLHNDVVVPEGDVLIHCGDLLSDEDNGLVAASHLDVWFARQPCPLVLCTAGNHDNGIERALLRGTNPFEHAHLLVDQGFTHRGMLFWGAPWVPHMPGWPFHLPDDIIAERWAMIPKDVDVLITHTPAAGYLDVTSHGVSLGCLALRDALERITPRLHCFGHIHSSHGRLKSGETLFVNAALAHKGGMGRDPIVIDLEPR